ncbi:hypothetical protein BC827DRAFT_1266018 [Russula dissimulans]|nr:hypothetical protein BC827DRAFT_1266018 [Russula dissimulans]
MPSHEHQPTRLTKKQKKATAFRERGRTSKGTRTLREGKGKGKGKPRIISTGHNGDDVDDDEDAHGVPAMEDQDQALAAMAGDPEEGAQGDGRRALRPGVAKGAVGSTEARKKSDRDRKRSRGGPEPEDGEAQPATKKARLARRSGEIPPPVAQDEDDDDDEGAGMSVVKDGDGGHKSGGMKDKEHKTQRYILFIGTHGLSTSPPTVERAERVRAHRREPKVHDDARRNPEPLLTVRPTMNPNRNYVPAPTHADPPPTVRLLTPKAPRAGATISKSKGCAFLEFSTRPALQAALRLHQSELEGRRINVELTAGGGGKGDARLAKVKERNKLLTTQRTRRTLKAAKAQGKDAAEQETLQPQRFSTTSGVGDVPQTKRTWSVGDGSQSGEHHGRAKRGKKRGTRTKNWGTGVNALPIG